MSEDRVSVTTGASAVCLKITLSFTWKLLRKLCPEMIGVIPFLLQTRTPKATSVCNDAPSSCPGRAWAATGNGSSFLRLV